jgi:hypothetical protein
MPPEPRRPDPSLEVIFEPPAQVPPDQVVPPIRLGLTDILAHLTTNAQEQARVAAVTRRDQGMDPQRIDELNQRLENVRRLAEELQVELAALEEMRPADPGEPVIT